MNTVISPYILNPTEGDWKGHAGFLTGGLSCICFVWVYFRLPEMKGRTYEEIGILFEKRVPARKFKGYHVDAYEEGDEADLEKPKVQQVESKEVVVSSQQQAYV